jgi:hypothetical protein
MEVDKAYESGYDAYHYGSDVTDNPYKKSQIEYQEWEEGFLSAMDFDFQKEEES